MRLRRWAGALEEGEEEEFRVGDPALQRPGILRPGSLGKGKLLGIWGHPVWGQQVCGSQREYNRAISISGGAFKCPSRARTAEVKVGGLKAMGETNATLQVSDNKGLDEGKSREPGVKRSLQTNESM